MRSITFTTILLFARGLTTVTAASSVCSSGIYATLAPLETYAPAQSYCASHYPGTVTKTVTATPSAKVRRATTSKSTSSTGKTTLTTTKSTTTSQDARASKWSSLLSQASGIVSTFCACAGYPATTTTTVTSTPTAIPAQCVNGIYQQSSTGNCYNVQCNKDSFLSGNVQTFDADSINACFQACNQNYCQYSVSTQVCNGAGYGSVGGDDNDATYYVLTTCPVNKRDILGDLS